VFLLTGQVKKFTMPRTLDLTVRIERGFSGIGKPISCNGVWKDAMTMPRRPNRCSSNSVWFHPEYPVNAVRGSESPELALAKPVLKYECGWWN
jgi:hypothetical protein